MANLSQLTKTCSPLFSSVLLKIKPRTTPTPAVKKSLALIKSLLVRAKLDATPVLGGSFAKNTYLSGDHDVDVFVRFGTTHRDADLSSLLESALKSLGLERLHGSRDYFHVERDGLRYELVPVIAIKKASDARNITDFSPWHVKWVQENGKKYVDDIRLAKRFCKANKCYGAESYIRGLSGHVLDILVIHYKGFLPLLRAAAKWKPKVIIDHYNVHKGKSLTRLNSAKVESPLVLIDPVQPDRNAASALSMECFERFVMAAQSFVAKPSVALFEDKVFDPKAVRKKKNTVLLHITPIDAKEDKAGAKLVQAYQKILETISVFGVRDSGWEWSGSGNGYFWYTLKIIELPPTREQEGPPSKLLKHAESFRAKYRTVTSRSGKLYATVPTEHRTPMSAIHSVQTYINERLLSWKDESSK